MNTTSLAARKALYGKARKVYYNSKSGHTLMTDAEFDALEDSIREQDPSWPDLSRTGVRVGEKTEVSLPTAMPSLNKIYMHESARLTSWIARVSYVHASPKIDGSSVLLQIEYGRLTNMYTRGDGLRGKTLTHLIPHVSVKYHEVAKFAKIPLVLVRCEAVLHESDFAPFASEFDTARAAVAGVLNRKSVHQILPRIRFLALRILSYGTAEVPSPACSSQLLVEAFGVDSVVPSRVLRAKELVADLGMLKTLRTEWEGSGYALDGIVLVDNVSGLEQSGDKPRHSIAVKDNDATETLTTRVRTVVWQESRYGAFKPKAQLAPVLFKDGTRVEFASLHNAKWVEDKRVGPGAVVQVIRSGEVIPKIVAVKRAAPQTAMVWPDAETEFRGVDLHRVGASTDTAALARAVAYSVEALGFEHVSSKFAEALAPRLKKDRSAIPALVRKLLTHPEKVFAHGGLSEKMVVKVVASQKSKPTLEQVLCACGLFPAGMGARRAALLATCLRQRSTSRADLTGALGEVFGTKFFDVLQSEGWRKFAADPAVAALIVAPVTAKRVIKGNKLAGQYVSWTGYRNDSEESWVTEQGGTVVKFGAKTTILLHKDSGKTSSKLDKARAKGIRICTFQNIV